MAKGIEDTTFYRWHRLVALNEVGGDPAVLDDASPAAAARRGPPPSSGTGRSAMTTLSTHDTKRSEDVRARLLAVAGDADGWERCSRRLPRGGRRRGRRPARPRTCSGRRWSGVGFDRPPSGCTSTSSRRSARPSSTRPGPTPDEAYEARVLALADRRPGPRRPARRGGRRGRRQRRARSARRCLAAEAAPAAPARASRTSTRAASSSTSRWSTPTTAAPSTTPRGRPGWPGWTTARARPTSTTRSCWSPRGRCGCAAGPGAVRRGVVRPAAGDSEHALGFLVRPGRARRDALRPGRRATWPSLVTRAPHRLAAGGGWGDATVTLPEGQWRDELTGRVLTGGTVAVRRRAGATCRWPCWCPDATKESAMREFEVWAPSAAERVELLLGQRAASR